MKLFIVLALMTAVSFAQELTVQDYLKGTFEMKSYQGVVPGTSNPCSMSFRDQGDSIRISAGLNGMVVGMALIPYNSHYSIARNRFLTGQSSIGPRGQQKEQIFMTRKADMDLQYFVVEETLSSGRETLRTTVECLIKL